jgi:3-hydroxyacyl-CoA dehydrogenase
MHATWACSLRRTASRLIADAKALAIEVATGYSPVFPLQDVAVTGDGGAALLEPWIAQQGERLSAGDKAIAGKLAFVLSGGRQAGRKQVSEQDLLDLEREAVLSLCGTRT